MRRRKQRTHACSQRHKHDEGRDILIEEAETRRSQREEEGKEQDAAAGDDKKLRRRWGCRFRTPQEVIDHGRRDQDPDPGQDQEIPTYR